MSFIKYDFAFEGGRCWSHEIPMVTAPLSLPDPLPEWTRLTFHQCAHCPLNGANHPSCPLAATLVAPVQALAGIPSWTPVTVRVTSPARIVTGETTLQRAAGSMMGLLSALSGCPHTRPMLPMAMFHLPFSSAEETLFRVMGMYLAGQHLRSRAGLPADWDMQGLVNIYRNLRTVNNGLAARIRAAAEHESSLNAIVLLDILAMDIGASIEDKEDALADMFAFYLQANDPA